MTTQIKGDATSTFGSDIDVTGNVVTDAPAFSVRNTASQSITTSTDTKLTWDTKIWDLTTDFDLTNNRFVPSVEGYYQFNASFYFLSPTDQSVVQTKLLKNGSVYKYGTITTASGTGHISPTLSVSAYANGSTDYFELYVWQNTGATKTVHSPESLTWFDGYLVRAV